MASFKKFAAYGMAALAVTLVLSGCGKGDEAPTLEETNSTSAPASPQDIQPDLHTNLPPPDTKNEASLPEETAENFFKNKQAYDGFSPQLKERIYQSYTASPSEPLAGSYNTLLGPTTPVMYVMSGEMSDCDPTSTFLCLDSPADQFETIQPGIDVIGKINLNQLAVFSANDPVAVVSVFNNSTGGSASEIPILPADILATANPDFGKFSAAVGLGGAGHFTIVVTAYKVTSEGSNELVSLMVTGSRIEPPRIEFVEAKPNPQNYLAEPAKRHDPVNNGAVIAAEALDIKIKLLTAGGNGVQTRFESYNETDQLQSVSVAVPQDDGTILGKVYLHQGLNKIKILSHAPAIDAQLGDSAPPPAELDFTVFNAWGGPRLKILKPETDGLIPQEAEGQKVELQFCYSFVPSKTQGSAGGSGSLTPTLSDDCVTGSLGFTPELTVNGREIGAPEDPKHDTVDFNATTGTFTAHLTPDFGINLYQIRAENVIAPELPVDSKTTSEGSGAFLYGVPMPLFKDGQINQVSNFPQFTNFTKRGLYIDVNKSMIEGDVKTMVIKFLERDETKNLLLDNFKSVANKPGYVCEEFKDPNTGKPAISNGDTTINFIKDTFELGQIELTDMSAGSDGLLHVGVRVNGMHGDADLRATEGNGNTFNGMDLGFLPIAFSIAKLEVNIGVAFPKKSDIDLNKDGVYEPRSVLDIRQISGVQFLSIVGDGPLGRPVYVNSARNPLAAGIELLDWQSGLLLNQFNTIIGGTILCGLENGLNNEASGVLGRAVVDLEKLTGYDKNIFRLPLNFDIALLGKTLSLDVAYDLLKGEVKIDSTGIHIHNVPLRFNPGPTELLKLVKEFTAGVVGAVSRWKSAMEPAPLQSFTSVNNNLSLQLGEDGLNQALFAAVMSGLLDLSVDANFYTEGKITPADRLTPSGKDLAPAMDVNQDGLVDVGDELTPISLEVRPNKQIPPTLSFLSQEEVAAFVEEEQASIAGAGPPGASPEASPDATETKIFFKPDGQYFRLAAGAIEITAYRHEPVADSLGGVGHYCKVAWHDDPSMGAKGFCILAADAFIDAKKYPALCAGKELFPIPRLNGDKVSQGIPNADNLDKPVPLYRVKLGVVLHGKFSGINREVSAKARITDPAAPEKTVLHLQMAPSATSKRALILSVDVLENNTGASDAQVAGVFDTIVRGGFGSDCTALNELRIAIPGKIEGSIPAGETEPQDLLPDFKVESLDLGGDSGNLPAVFIDDSRLYLDILIFAGLNFTDEAAASGDSTTGGN